MQPTGGGPLRLKWVPIQHNGLPTSNEIKDTIPKGTINPKAGFTQTIITGLRELGSTVSPWTAVRVGQPTINPGTAVRWAAADHFSDGSCTTAAVTTAATMGNTAGNG